jgi:PPOX class probable F420-dependent enzyme
MSSPLLTPTGLAVLVTLRRDGRPQLSNIGYAHDPATGRIRISLTDTRAKTRNLRRDPRASLYLTSPDFRSYLVLDGTVELSPVTTAPRDATADELVDLYRTIAGEHPDWAEYRQAMIAEQRLVATFTAEHSYGFDGQG